MGGEPALLSAVVGGGALGGYAMGRWFSMGAAPSGRSGWRNASWRRRGARGDKVDATCGLWVRFRAATALRRDGARAGDAIYVSGRLGGSALGLATGRGAAWAPSPPARAEVGIGTLFAVAAWRHARIAEAC